MTVGGTVLFALAAILGHAGYVDGEVGTAASWMRSTAGPAFERAGSPPA